MNIRYRLRNYADAHGIPNAFSGDAINERTRRGHCGAVNPRHRLWSFNDERPWCIDHKSMPWVTIVREPWERMKSAFYYCEAQWTRLGVAPGRPGQQTVDPLCNVGPLPLGPASARVREFGRRWGLNYQFEHYLGLDYEMLRRLPCSPPSAECSAYEMATTPNGKFVGMREHLCKRLILHACRLDSNETEASRALIADAFRVQESMLAIGLVEELNESLKLFERVTRCTNLGASQWDTYRGHSTLKETDHEAYQAAEIVFEECKAEIRGRMNVDIALYEHAKFLFRNQRHGAVGQTAGLLGPPLACEQKSARDSIVCQSPPSQTRDTSSSSPSWLQALLSMSPVNASIPAVQAHVCTHALQAVITTIYALFDCPNWCREHRVPCHLSHQSHSSNGTKVSGSGNFPFTLKSRGIDGFGHMAESLFQALHERLVNSTPAYDYYFPEGFAHAGLYLRSISGLEVQGRTASLYCHQARYEGRSTDVAELYRGDLVGFLHVHFTCYCVPSLDDFFGLSLLASQKVGPSIGPSDRLKQVFWAAQHEGISCGRKPQHLVFAAHVRMGDLLSTPTPPANERDDSGKIRIWQALYPGRLQQSADAFIATVRWVAAVEAALGSSRRLQLLVVSDAPSTSLAELLTATSQTSEGVSMRVVSNNVRYHDGMSGHTLMRLNLTREESPGWHELELDVLDEGNPLIAIQCMAAADILITGAPSFFSHLAGELSRGRVLHSGTAHSVGFLDHVALRSANSPLPSPSDFVHSLVERLT